MDMTEPSIWDLSEAKVQRTLAKLAIDERLKWFGRLTNHHITLDSAFRGPRETRI
jgi:hypothetical protein